jgi:hypothetical protein
MPEQRIIEVKPHQLAKGDIIQNNQRHVVTGRPEVKQKYAYVPLEGFHRTAKMPMHEVIRVSREFPTEAEQAELEYYRNVETIHERYALVTKLVSDYKIKLTENLDIKDPSWHGRYWYDLAKAQLEFELWDRVMTVAERRGIDVTVALDLVTEQLREDFVNRYTFIPRSSNQISNLVEAIKNEVTADFLRDVKWRMY